MTRPPFECLYRNSLGLEPFRFIDLFAGIGGMRLPFQELGGRCVFTSEWDSDAQKTYQANFGEVPAGDITAIANDDIPRHDLLLAGFPCQSFSITGRRKGLLDTRGTLFFEIERILEHHRPKAFLLENVPGLKTHDMGRTLETIMGKLLAQDYEVSYGILYSRDFGLPQSRPRIYMVGMDRKGLPSNGDPNRILERVSNRFKPDTWVGMILERNGDVAKNLTLSDTRWTAMQKYNAAQLEKGRRGYGDDRFYDVYQVSDPFIKTLLIKTLGEGRALIDQGDIGRNPRKLTPREGARLQGFPERFIVDAVPYWPWSRQIGNSVSVPVIRALAYEMLPYLT